MSSELKIWCICTLSVAIFVIASWISLNAGAEFNLILDILKVSLIVSASMCFFIWLLSAPIKALLLMHLGTSLMIWQKVIVSLAEEKIRPNLTYDYYPWWGEGWLYSYLGLVIIFYSLYFIFTSMKIKPLE